MLTSYIARHFAQFHHKTPKIMLDINDMV